MMTQSTIGDLRIALARLTAIGGPGVHDQWSKHERILAGGIDELAALRAQVAQMRSAIEDYESIYGYFVSQTGISASTRLATLEMHQAARKKLQESADQ